MVGFYDDTQLAGGLRFTPINPTRIVDSRIGLGAPHRLGPNSTTTVTAPSSVAGPDTVALSMNVTGVNPDTATYLTLYPGGGQRPTTSTLNLTAHEIRSNAAPVLLDVNNQFSIFNPASTVDVVIDVAGRFDALPAAVNALTGPSAADQSHTPKDATPYRHAG